MVVVVLVGGGGEHHYSEVEDLSPVSFGGVLVTLSFIRNMSFESLNMGVSRYNSIPMFAYDSILLITYDS